MLKTAGLHHITAITGDVQANVNFYEGVLGQRFVKKTVNFDDPSSYHLYYGDYVGTPGTALTFFSWPQLPARQPGPGEASAWYYRIPEASLDFWERRLAAYAVPFERTLAFGVEVIKLQDPDAHEVWLVPTNDTPANLVLWEDAPVPVEHQLRGFYGIRLAVAELTLVYPVLTDVFGYTESASDEDVTRFVSSGAHAEVIDVVTVSGAPARQGLGSIHHVAFRAKDDAEREAFLEALEPLEISSTGLVNRIFFNASYFFTPAGNLFEISTDQPGFTVNEPAETLGESMILPPWYEPYRNEIEAHLPPITLPRHGGF